jgi:hypothetical protein
MANTPKALNIRAKTKPALLENDPGETGYQLYNGGGGGSRTYVGPYSHKGLQRLTECLLNIHFSMHHTPSAKNQTWNWD